MFATPVLTVKFYRYLYLSIFLLSSYFISKKKIIHILLPPSSSHGVYMLAREMKFRLLCNIESLMVLTHCLVDLFTKNMYFWTFWEFL